MGKAIEISQNIYWVGVNDRKTYLFENLWPLDKGMAYNSYVINDEKKALIDTVESGYGKEFLNNIKQVIGDNKLDYLIINHMEPDHSGSMLDIVKLYPEIKIICNKLMSKMIEAYYDLSENLVIIKEGDTLKLGKTTLQFYMTPWLHWPETMMTYEISTKTLFSGDAFGSFGALDAGIFDDEQVNLYEWEIEARRYYSNIVGKFTSQTQTALTKLQGLEVKTITATHGLIWRKSPQTIISWYNNWSCFKTLPGVVIAYSSMYGNTALMAELVAKLLSENNVKDVKIYDTSKTHMSFIVSDIWKYKGVILASPTYNLHLHPTMQTLVSELTDLSPKERLLGIIGTYTWNSKAVKELEAFATAINWEIISEPIEINGAYKNKYLDKFVDLAKNMAQKLGLA